MYVQNTEAAVTDIITASNLVVYVESSESDCGPDPEMRAASCGAPGVHSHPCGPPLSLLAFLRTRRELSVILITGDIWQTRQTSLSFKIFQKVFYSFWN